MISNSLMMIDMITRDAVKPFKNSNAFLMSMQWDELFAEPLVTQAIQVPVVAALAMGAAAVVIKNPTVSRRSMGLWWREFITS